MIFFYFFYFCLSQTIFFNISAPDEQNCENSLGCNLKNLNSSIQDNDSIKILNTMLEKENAKRFLDIINASTYRNISLIGSDTIISNPGINASENSAIYVENSTFSISNISFDTFEIPVLNGLNSSCYVSNCSFTKSKCTASALIAFINSTIEFNNSFICDNDANTQSLFVAVNSTVQFNFLNASTNFLESRDIRAAFHFLNANVTFTDVNFYSNTLKLPLTASSNSSHLTFRRALFDFNNAYCISALEHSSTVRIYDSVFKNNQASIVAGGINSSFTLCDSHILNQMTDEMLIGLSESDISVKNCTFKDSSVAALAFSNPISEIPKTMLFIDTNISNIKTKISLFTSVSGNAIFNNIYVNDVKSEAEIIAITQNGNGKLIIHDSEFQFLQSASKVSAAISVMNTSFVHLNRVNIVHNMVCGALFENSTVLVENSNFSLNQCLPQGNSIPLAILTSSLINNVTIHDTDFMNNTALTGSVFFMNSTSYINNAKFIGNQAVQGAAIFAAGMNITAKGIEFIGNNAMSQGGAISLTEGNAIFENCKFIDNTSPEAGVMLLRDTNNITIKNALVKDNNATNSTFINAVGDSMLLVLEDVEVDDPFERSIFLSNPDSITLENARFNCRSRCKSISKIAAPPKKENKNPPLHNQNPPVEHKKQEQQPNHRNNEDLEIEDPLEEPNEDNSAAIFWILIPIALVLALILYFRFGPRGVKRAINSILRMNSKHDV